MMNRNEKILELKSVSKSYGSGHTVVEAVRSVDLAISRGEIVLIMGPSGSGKTTMLSMAGGLLAPTSGEIYMSGQPLSTLDSRGISQLRLRQVGFVFQAFNLLAGLSALENVALVMNLAGRHDSTVERDSKALLTRLGLEKRFTHVPADLSGGEKQRVALARALANDPPLILADEPTGNLDSKSGREVMDLLVRLAREENKAVVIVTHDPRIIDIADRVLWLEDGLLAPAKPQSIAD
ncbi:MAG: ABC transporter ATP-binding protein [Actinobacteria bacterium]|nr:ABC transporter ATP-binding protein [Actinomycetota bacterium]